MNHSTSPTDDRLWPDGHEPETIVGLAEAFPSRRSATGLAAAPTPTPAPPRHVLVWPEHGLEMAFRIIPAGSFRMGSRGYSADEEPIHRVRIPRPFWMAETPVTRAQWALWTRAENIKHENHFKDRPDHPAENLDWRQAMAFCAWLGRGRAAELPEGLPLASLPTEAEWEYACRAGTDTDYYAGDGEAALAEAGWFGEPWGSGSTHPVGRKRINASQLYDLHGNVWEWCHDAWGENAYRVHADGDPDPGWTYRLKDWHSGLQKTMFDHTRVLRGGSWNIGATYCRSAESTWFKPFDRAGDFGFRVCLVGDPAADHGKLGTQQSEVKQAPGDAGATTSQIMNGS